MHLPTHLPDFNRASILVVGDVMLDRYWFGATARVSPEAPVPIVNVNNVNNRPGGAGNVALNLAALGAKVTLLGIAGQDEAGDLLKQQLEAAQVKTNLCQASDCTTIVKLRIISRHQQLIRLDFEAPLKTDLQPLINEYRQALASAQLVILSDYNKGTLKDPALFIQLAREANVPVIVDPKGLDFSRYQRADLLTPNLIEFQAIVGAFNDEEDFLRKGQQLLAQLQLKSLLVTRGESGMTLFHENETLHFPAIAREVLDVTGAGDTVISLLGASLAAGAPITEAVAIANLAASIVVGKLGAATISVPELQVSITGKTNFLTGIMNEVQLLEAVKEARIQNKKIVFTNGCFDILHAGHVNSLQAAKALGDLLIVAVNTDASIQKLKGHNRPINHLEHRMTVLAGLGVVDWVIPFADDTPERLLTLLKPDFLAKGNDYALDQVVGADIVKAYGGEVRVVDSRNDASSSKIIEKILKTTPSSSDKVESDE